MPSFPGTVTSVTATSTPGTTLYTGPLRSGQGVRIQIRAVTLSETLATITIEHDIGAEHPSSSAGIVKVVDSYSLPIVGLPILVLDHVIFGGATDPDKITAYVDAGTVIFTVEAEVARSF